MKCYNLLTKPIHPPSSASEILAGVKLHYNCISVCYENTPWIINSADAKQIIKCISVVNLQFHSCS